MPRAAGLPHLNGSDSELDLIVAKPSEHILAARPTPSSTTHHGGKYAYLDELAAFLPTWRPGSSTITPVAGRVSSSLVLA